ALQAGLHRERSESMEERAGGGQDDIIVEANVFETEHPVGAAAEVDDEGVDMGLEDQTAGMTAAAEDSPQEPAVHQQWTPSDEGVDHETTAVAEVTETSAAAMICPDGSTRVEEQDDLDRETFAAADVSPEQPSAPDQPNLEEGEELVLEFYTATDLLDHATVEAATDVRPEPESAQPAAADAALQAGLHRERSESMEDRAGSGQDDIIVEANVFETEHPVEEAATMDDEGGDIGLEDQNAGMTAAAEGSPQEPAVHQQRTSHETSAAAEVTETSAAAMICPDGSTRVEEQDDLDRETFPAADVSPRQPSAPDQPNLEEGEELVLEFYTATGLLDHATVQAATDVRPEPESAQPAAADAALQAGLHREKSESMEERAGSGQDDIIVEDNVFETEHPVEEAATMDDEGVDMGLGDKKGSHSVPTATPDLSRMEMDPPPPSFTYWLVGATVMPVTAVVCCRR
ncbi:unnamed protein product, partial [Scytosiphon promiscuus]